MAKKVIIIIILSLLSLGLDLPGAVLAHESRDLINGKYQVRVGFLSEPAYQGLENGLDLTICTGQCVSNKDNSGTLTNGLIGAFETLKVEVIFGKQTMPLNLVAVSRNPGRYAARFLPTSVGDYSFHIFGTLGPDKDKIDERFTSGPNSFDSVLPLTAIQFPSKLAIYPTTDSSPAAVPSPSVANPVITTPTANQPTIIAPAANTEPALSNSDLQALRQQLSDQQKQLDSAKANLSSAGTLAAAGMGIGVFGLVLASLALVLSRRSPKPRRESEGG